MYTGVCISDAETRCNLRPLNGNAHICTSHVYLIRLHSFIDKSYRDYGGLKKKIAAILQDRASAEPRVTRAREFYHLRSRSHVSIATTTPVAKHNTGDTHPIQSSVEGAAQQPRSSITFRIPQAILNKIPGSGTATGRVYRGILRSPGREPHLENTNSPDMRLPSPIQSIPEQPEPEDPAPRRSDLHSMRSFALPPPALPVVQEIVSSPQSR
jgi:hypothetical protein